MRAVNTASQLGTRPVSTPILCQEWAEALSAVLAPEAGRAVVAPDARRAMFLAARDRTHGKEAIASHRAEFIAAGGHTVMWPDFEAAMAEWAVDLEATKVVQEDWKRQKAVKKRESCRRKKEEAAGRDEESLAEIEARSAAAYKAGKENAGVWPACPDGSM